MKIYDISQELFSCVVWPGDPAPARHTLNSIDNGDLYNLTAFSMCAHNGTHIDAPSHFINGAKSVDAIDLSKFIGEAFVADVIKDAKKSVSYIIVNEAGASVYSASKLAIAEFPNLHVEERSAISIARRLQDPLSELVKIDSKSIGIGQYQHDVNQKQLDEKLDFVGPNICPVCGRKLEFFMPWDMTCASCLQRPPLYQKMRAACIYNEGIKSLILPFKHADRLEILPFFLLAFLNF